MSYDKFYVEKELSWLAFNERVLQEAADTSVPMIERVRFLGIYSNNMDEFFRVRVADAKRRMLLEKVPGADSAPRHLLAKIQSKVLRLQQDFDQIYVDIMNVLANRNIFLINEQQLTPEQGNWLRTFFRDKIQRHIGPIVVSDKVNLEKVLKDDLTYLVVELRSKDRVQYVLIEVPSDQVQRFILLPHEKGRNKKSLIMLDNIIRYCLDDIFRPFFDYERAEAYSIKMTRDAEYDLSEDVEQSLLDKMSIGLKQRLTGQPVRFVYDRDMPEAMVEFIKHRLGISTYDAVIPGGRYHNFRDFMDFPNVGRKYLEHPELPALNSREFAVAQHVFDAITRQDILLYYPYHKFRHVTEFVREAAFDPAVLSISISIYRVAKNSRIIKSLIDAAENGKKVTVIVELRARFDEEANIDWARQLTESGVKVDFGIPSLKCHSKLILVERVENGTLTRYAHIGTGNFHERTAKVYTDFSLFTKNSEITQEVANAFDFIMNSYKRYAFHHLLVSPNDNRRKLNRMIDKEIRAARDGRKAEIFVKVNNLVDKGLIERLYKASTAGVRIRMIIRGMCSLVPGIPGVSENIEIISIVDRFLEHPRVYWFHAEGEEQVIISSADWMTRNLDGRVEVGCPVYDPVLKQRIIDIMEIQWTDTTKARIIDKEQSNHYKPRGNRRKIRSQIAIYQYLKAIEQGKS